MLRRIAHKLLLGGILAVLSTGTLTWLTLDQISAWNQAAKRLEDGSHVAVMDGIFHSSLTRAMGEAVSFAVTGSEEYVKEATEALIYAHSAMAQLRRATGDPEERNRQGDVRLLRQRQEAVLVQVRTNVNQALRTRDRTDTLGDQLRLLYAAEEEADAIWRDVLAWHDSERRARAQEMRTIERRLFQWLSATLLLGVLWVLGLVAFLGGSVVAPIKRLARAAERVAAGDLEQQVRVTSHDEIGALQRSFNRMVQGFRERGAAVIQTEPNRTHQADAQRTATAADERGESQPVSTTGEKRVLLVETGAPSRELTKAMLQHCGLEVTTAESGAEARSAFAGQSFALVLLDCDLPATEVAETVEHIRRSASPKGNIPIVALAATDGPEGTNRSLAGGMNDHLTKPVSFFELHALLSRWLPPA